MSLLHALFAEMIDQLATWTVEVTHHMLCDRFHVGTPSLPTNRTLNYEGTSPTITKAHDAHIPSTWPGHTPRIHPNSIRTMAHRCTCPRRSTTTQCRRRCRQRSHASCHRRGGPDESEWSLRRSFYATLHFGERGMERRTPLLRLRYHGNCGQRAAKCHCHSLPLRSVQGAACSMHVEVM